MGESVSSGNRKIMGQVFDVVTMVLEYYLW